MSLEAALIARMKAINGIYTKTSERIWEGRAPRKFDSDYITISRTGGQPHHHMENASAFGESTFQIDVWSKTIAGRRALAEACRLGLDGWQGTQDGIRIQSIDLDPPVNTEEATDRGRDGPDYRARIDARVFFEQDAPTQ